MSGASKTVKTVDGSLIDCGDEQIDDLSEVVSLDVPDGANVAVIQAQEQNVRLRNGEATPAADVGLQIEAGDSITYTGDLSKVRMIEETEGAVVHVLYFYAG